MSKNWKKGLFRIWLVMTILWVLVFGSLNSVAIYADVQKLKFFDIESTIELLDKAIEEHALEEKLDSKSSSQEGEIDYEIWTPVPRCKRTLDKSDSCFMIRKDYILVSLAYDKYILDFPRDTSTEVLTEGINLHLRQQRATKLQQGLLFTLSITLLPPLVLLIIIISILWALAGFNQKEGTDKLM